MNGNPAGAPITVVPGKPEHPVETARSANEGEFQRFEELTSKLTKIPKSEIDEQRQQS